MKVRVQKIKNLPATKPSEIRVGYTFEMFVDEDLFTSPVIGEIFPNSGRWSTAVVTKIVNENTFQTVDSEYVWEITEEIIKYKK
jgi:hypothetical protein